jgi:DNA polymerase-3 subunit gamma/tau
MSYIVTARKWRPQKFNEVVGQEHITTTLKNAIKDGRIAHAYLFTGPRGVGKTTTARILAKVLNCLKPVDFEPCDKCEICQSIKSGQFFDIIEIDAASNRGIDDIRTLRESVKYAPAKGKYKVYIIDEVHMLTKESFNAFLKTLEEPPLHTLFIFATTDVHKVPLTITSRCQRFDFRRIDLETIKTLLSKIAESEQIEIDDKTLTLIARKADGALRDAESYFDQVVSFCGNKVDAETVTKILNLIDDEIYFKLSDAVLDKNFKVVFEATEEIYKNGWNFNDFMDGLIEHFRNIMTVIITGSNYSIESAEVFRKRYSNYADKFSEGDILRLMNFLNRTAQELRFSQNQKLKIEIALCHLIGLEQTSTISELIRNLDNVSTGYPVLREKQEKKSPVIPEQKAIEKEKFYTFKDPVQEPEYKYTAANNSDLNSIISKWKEFADLVSEEKKFTLGHFFYNVQPVDLAGSKVSLRFSNENEIKSFNYNIDYLTKKAEEYFGKRLQFKAIEGANVRTINKPSEVKSAKTNEIISETGDQYIDLIINELGGEEIS